MSQGDVPATIMIVDDEPENLNVLGEMLRHEGWDVRAFPRGEMALAAAREEPPDLMLLDIRMPDLDGYEVCRRFQADQRLRSIPIIFLSAFSEPADKLRAFDAGGVDYVTKPFAEVEVLARTRLHLRLRRYQLALANLVLERVQELAEAHRRLRIWDDAKNQWLTTLSHELRTPLNGVIGILELLFMDLPADSTGHAMRPHYEASRRRIEKLIDDALTLSQIDVAAESFQLHPVRLGPVLRSVMESFTQQCPKVTVRTSLDAVEAVEILADSRLLVRAFSDLLAIAACCATAGEAITLASHATAQQAKVVVGTGGPRLTPEALETFFEVGGQRTPLKGGDFGLGAAVASRILQLFRGHVSIRNGSERGLVLEIFLPVHRAARPEKHLDAPSLRGGRHLAPSVAPRSEGGMS